MSWGLLQNTILLGVGTVMLASLSAIAVFVVSLVVPRQISSFLAVLAGTNLLLPQFLSIAVWMELFGGKGVVGTGAVAWLYTLPGAILLLSMLLWPISFFFMLTRRQAILRTVLALDPFASGVAFWRLLGGQLKRPLVWGAVFVFGLAVNNLSVPGILQVRVLAEEILVRFSTRLELGAVTLLALPLLVLALGMCCFVTQVRWGRDSLGASLSPEMIGERLGVGALALSVVLSLIVVGVGLGLPISYLLFSSATWGDLLPTLQASRAAVGNSVLFAVLSATSIVIGGGLLLRFRVARYFWAFLILPGTLLGAYLASVNNWIYALGVDFGWIAVVLGLSLRFLGMGVSGVGLAFSGADRRLVEMAQLEGLGSWERFRFCLWPQSKGALLALWWLVYVLCLWEVEVLIFMIPPGLETLGLRVFNLLHYGHNSQVNASCLLLILMGLTPWLGWALWRGISLSGLGRRWTPVAVVFMLLGVTACDQAGPSVPALQSRFFERVESVGFKGTGVAQFNKPRSVTVTQNNDVFAVDMTGRVQRFRADGEYLGFWQMPETERGRPKGMGIDSQGRVIVVEPHYARVNHFTSEGELKLQWGEFGAEAGQLAFPRAIVRHSSGDLFVTEFQRVERVQRFSPEGQRLVQTFGAAGKEAGELNRAEGVGIDSQDRLFVADSCNHRIQVFDDSGNPLVEYGQAGSGLGELSYPYDVKIDKDGFQFVCEFGNSRIQVFNPKFEPVELIGGPGTALGRFSNPWSIAMDSEGNLWVADSGNHRLQKLIRRQHEP